MNFRRFANIEVAGHQVSNGFEKLGQFALPPIYRVHLIIVIVSLHCDVCLDALSAVPCVSDTHPAFVFEPTSLWREFILCIQFSASTQCWRFRISLQSSFLLFQEIWSPCPSRCLSRSRRQARCSCSSCCPLWKVSVHVCLPLKSPRDAQSNWVAVTVRFVLPPCRQAM